MKLNGLEKIFYEMVGFICPFHGCCLLHDGLKTLNMWNNNWCFMMDAPCNPVHFKETQAGYLDVTINLECDLIKNKRGLERVVVVCLIL